VFDDHFSLATRRETMTRGHQERLAPMVAEAMAEAARPFAGLDRIAVTVGPGSFTGVRVGLAFAKGLSVALGRPCAGVSTLRALAASHPGDARRAAVIDGGRSLFFQLFDGAAPHGAPEALTTEDVRRRIDAYGPVALLIGPHAKALAMQLPAAEAIDLAAPTPAAIAALSDGPRLQGLQPLYMRAPDARPRR
jgi:tRNA threonylcarbamoyladenosine biosynthesis protein TsaB